MAQKLCRHLQRCINHDDVAKQIARYDLDRTLTQWAFTSISDLQQEMGLWEWNQTPGTKWARAAKCMQLLDMKYNWEPVRADGEGMVGTSWAEATRELRTRELLGVEWKPWGVATSHGRKVYGIWIRNSGNWSGKEKIPFGQPFRRY